MADQIPVQGPGRRHPPDQHPPAQFLYRETLPGQWQDGLRSGPQLLLLPGRIGCLPDRILPGRRGLFQI